ncbi:MAG: hypothetical protein CSA74_02970 [Rhodobacterales bacterium]|nr:MAG: hypothetical protein CSA74_02970 [Rhodobacterales bacterium]
MKSSTRVALAAAFTLSTIPAVQAADLPEVPSEPLTVTCADLGITPDFCKAGNITKDALRAMVLRGPLRGPAMAPLFEAGVIGRRGALPMRPEVEAPAEGEMPPMLMPVFDFEAYAEMMSQGLKRTVVLDDLGLEVTVPVVDCRFALCLPAGLSGGPAFVSWEEFERPEMPMPMMPQTGEDTAAKGETETSE